MSVFFQESQIHEEMVKKIVDRDEREKVLQIKFLKSFYVVKEQRCELENGVFAEFREYSLNIFCTKKKLLVLQNPISKRSEANRWILLKF